MVVRHRINKATVVNPLDKRQFYIELNYDQDSVVGNTEPQVSIKGVRLRREDAVLIKNYIAGGALPTPTTPGIFESLPHDIEMTHDGVTKIIDGYLDFTDGLSVQRDEAGHYNGVDVAWRLRKGMDWFNDRIDGFGYNYLIHKNNATRDLIQSKYIYVPYVINTVPNYREAFMALLTGSMIALQIAKSVETLIKELEKLIQIDPAGEVGQILSVVTELAYIAALYVSLAAIIIDFVLYVIQPVKYQVGMKITDLLEIACAELGLTFSSSIAYTAPYNSWVILPERSSLPSGTQELGSIPKIARIIVVVGAILIALALYPNPFTVIAIVIGLLTGVLQDLADKIVNFGLTLFLAKLQGYTSVGMAQLTDTDNLYIGKGFPDVTVGDIFRLWKQLTNSRYYIQGSTLVNLPKHENLLSPMYQLPDVRQDWVRFNTREFFATTTFSFARDFNDKNTIDNYKGNIFQQTIVPKIITNQDLVMTKNLREIAIPYSRGINKKELSVPEHLLSAMVKPLQDAGEFANKVYDTAAGIIQHGIDFLADSKEWMADQAEDIANQIIDLVNSLSGLIITGINNAINFINNVASFVGFGSSIGTLDPNDFVIAHVNFDGVLFDIFFVAVATALGLGPGLFLSLLAVVKPDLESINIPTVEDLVPGITLDRPNMLMLENDIMGTPKIVMVDLENMTGQRVCKLHKDNEAFVNAGWIFRNNYASDSFVPDPVTLRHNQWEIITPALNSPSETNRVPFGMDDLLKVLNNNKIMDHNGQVCELLSLQFYPEDGVASLTYRRNTLYTNNLKSLQYEPAGN